MALPDIELLEAFNAKAVRASDLIEPAYAKWMPNTDPCKWDPGATGFLTLTKNDPLLRAMLVQFGTLRPDSAPANDSTKTIEGHTYSYWLIKSAAATGNATGAVISNATAATSNAQVSSALWQQLRSRRRRPCCSRYSCRCARVLPCLPKRQISVHTHQKASEPFNTRSSMPDRGRYS